MGLRNRWPVYKYLSKSKLHVGDVELNGTPPRQGYITRHAYHFIIRQEILAPECKTLESVLYLAAVTDASLIKSRTQPNTSE